MDVVLGFKILYGFLWLILRFFDLTVFLLQHNFALWKYLLTHDAECTREINFMGRPLNASVNVRQMSIHHFYSCLGVADF